MKYILLLPVLFALQYLHAQNDTIWFDREWKRTTKEEAAFFRPPVKKEGNRYYLIDYYMDGQMQMEGWSFAEAGDAWDGDIKFYYPTGKLNIEAVYSQGKKNGAFKSYYANGNLKELNHYVNDSLEGEALVYFLDGSLRAKMFYKDNKQDGELMEYYANHQLRGVVHHKMGKLEGEWKEYFEDGKLKGTAQYRNNLLDGLLTAYKPDGKMDYTEEYVAGKKNGWYTWYQDNGTKKGEEKYADDKKAGEWRTYDDKGKLLKTFPSGYENDLAMYRAEQLKLVIDTIPHADGKYEEKYPDGKIRYEGAYSNNRKEGLWTLYNNKRNVLLEEHYLNGQLNGEQLYYNDKGQKIKLVPYLNGQLHGMVVEWDNQGEANLNLFFMKGEELYNRTEFYQKFYNKGVTTKGNVQIINMDELQEVETVQVEEIVARPVEHPLQMDTLSNEDGIVTLTTVLTHADLNTTTKNFDELKLKVAITRDGLYIMDQHKDYKPADNELVLWYEDNTGDFSGQELEFSVGKNIQAALKNKSLDIAEVIRILEHRVFKVEEFPGLYAFSKLEKEF